MDTICKHRWEQYETVCCYHERCTECGVIRKTGMCQFHADHALGYSGAAYFTRPDIGNFSGMIPQNRAQAEEFIAAESKMHVPLAEGSIIEIGAGIGRLIPILLPRAVSYLAVEPNPWAAEYIRQAYGPAAEVFLGTWEQAIGAGADTILAVHCLEHLRDADTQFVRMAESAEKRLTILVPDATDLHNPDHWWFFSAETLEQWFRAAGLRHVRHAVQKAAKENYIWMTGEK